MNEPTPVSEHLARAFESMMAVADKREARFRAELATVPQFGPCEACHAGTEALDESASLEESVRSNALRVVYGICRHCEREAATVERLARMGVPRRVRHATFENYEVYDPRQETVVRAVKGWLTDRQRWLLCLMGGYGTGKGHLASAAVRALGATASWITHPNLVNDYHGTPFDQRKRFKDRFKRFPVLVLDEMGTKGKTADTEELFYDILNLRHEEGLKTILIGNIPINAKEGLCLMGLIGAERMASRMEQHSTLLSCKWGDYRAREK